MCLVSSGYEMFREALPNHAQWTWPVFYDFNKVIELLEKIDTKLGNPDCVDETKKEFIQSVLEELKKQPQPKRRGRPPKKQNTNNNETLEGP